MDLVERLGELVHRAIKIVTPYCWRLGRQLRLRRALIRTLVRARTHRIDRVFVRVLRTAGRCLARRGLVLGGVFGCNVRHMNPFACLGHRYSGKTGLVFLLLRRGHDSVIFTRRQQIWQVGVVSRFAELRGLLVQGSACLQR